MDSSLAQYKDLFVDTGKEYLKSLSNALLKLEKDPHDTEAIAEIFRSAHSLKGQSAAMGYEKTGYLCHAVEDVFFEIKEGRLEPTPELADLLFTAFDDLGRSIDAIDADGQEIDLSPQAEALKTLTGVTTQGAGKSNRPAKKSKKSASPVKTKAPSAAPKPTRKPSKPAASPPLNEDAAATVERIKTIPVKVEQLDEMLNLLEELIVHRLVLKRLIREIDNTELRNYHNQTDKIIAALQFQIMNVRAVPVHMVFDHFPRAVRDLAREEQKKVDLVIEGGDLELDRTIVERLDEPLTHIIRNAVSHGIDQAGTIRLSARREKDYAVVEVSDDGLGVDWTAVAAKAHADTQDPAELKKLLFSGISTAKAVTQVSGRGVGLEVVKKTIEEFGGSIDVESEKGHGTTFIITLPLTLAVIKALLIRVGQARYAITAGLISRTIRISQQQVKKIADREVFVLEETEIPIIRLTERLQSQAAAPAEASGQELLLVILLVGDERIGFAVDEIIEASEMIIKPVPPILKRNAAFAGVTILGDGQSALILNPEGLL